jgi:ring-1,2-phenylacetyl-CoA epoxidase subunit PaaC
MWPLAAELFEHDELTARLVAEGIAVDARELRPAWEHFVTGVLEEATLAVPDTAYTPTGGRRGEHSESLGHLLAVMQSTHRAHPGATW